MDEQQEKQHEKENQQKPEEIEPLYNHHGELIGYRKVKLINELRSEENAN